MSRTWRTALAPRITPDETRFAEFTGVVNTRSRRDIGLKALYVGDNVYISDTKKITRRGGYTPYYGSGQVKAAYASDGVLYIAEGTEIKRLASPTDARTVTNVTAGKAINWATANGDTYFANGVEAGILRGDEFVPWRLSTPILTNVVPPSTPDLSGQMVGRTYTTALYRLFATYVLSDGRETAPSNIAEVRGSTEGGLFSVSATSEYARTNVYCTEPDGAVFRLVASTTNGATTFDPLFGTTVYTALKASSLPAGVTHVTFCGSRCFVGQYIPSLRTTIIWMSEPFSFHLWNRVRDARPIAGEVALLVENNQGVLIGTTDAIYQYNPKDDTLTDVVSYGVLPGFAGDADAQKVVYFWTQRGLCKAMPFENLTEKDISMPPGERAVGSMLYLGGLQQFVAITQGGGTPFNQRRERT